MNFRAIAFDLDGTLLDSDKKIRPSTIEAVKEAQNKGLKVMISTGRHPQAAHFFHHQLGLDTLSVCCNGACLFDYTKMSSVISNPLNTDEVKALYDLCRHYNFGIKLYTDEAITYEQNDKYIVMFDHWKTHLPVQFQPNLLKVDNYENYLSSKPDVWKYTLWAEDLSLMETLAQKAEDELGLSCEWWSTEGLDITRSDNTKGARLKNWADMEDIKMEEIIAFGDNFNDVTMLESVGLGVAMGQSDNKIKDLSKIVAPGDNNSDAIAEVLKQYI